MPAKKKSSTAKKNKLNPKHAAFIYEYIKNGGNAAKAYMKNFPNASYETARANSYKLLTNTHISKTIDAHYETLWKSKEKEIGRAFSSLLRIANCDISDVVEFENNVMKVKDFKSIDTSTIKSITQNVTETANGVNVHTSVVLHDKTKAISELLKVLNMINDKIELFGDIEIIPPTIPAELLTQTINED